METNETETNIEEDILLSDKTNVEIKSTVAEDNVEELSKLSQKQTTNLLSNGERTERVQSEPVNIASTPTLMSKCRIVKNLLVVCISFLMLLSAFMTLQNLQSTINRDEGLGTVGLSLLYFNAIVSSLFLPPVIISKLGCKWTMVASMMTYITYSAANFHATWATILPATIILGLGAANLWSSQMMYVSQLGKWYTAATGQPEKGTMSRFSGTFYTAILVGQLFGNLISSEVLSHPVVSNITITECGVNFCPYTSTNATALVETDQEKIIKLSAIMLVIGCTGILLSTIFLDNIKHESQDQNKKISLEKLKSVVKHIWESRAQKMLIPVTMYRGVGMSFLWGTFTVAFISCPHGVGSVGYVMMAYSGSSSVLSILFGYLANRAGLVFLYVVALVSHLSILLTVLLWNPAEGVLYPLFIMVTLWSVGDAVFRITVFVLYTQLFKDNSAHGYTCCNLFHFLGSATSFGYTGFLCTTVKIYITMIFLVTGVTLAIILKVQNRQVKEKCVVEQNVDVPGVDEN